MRKISLLVCLFIVSITAFSQHPVFNANDPVVTYNPSSPPVAPPYGTPAKWVRTIRITSWNTDNYKAYYYKGMAFRLRYPKNYDQTGNTKYPVVIFLTGRGSKGTVYDNEAQLGAAGQHHENAINNNQFNGFILMPQNTTGFFSSGHINAIHELIENHFVPSLHADPNRVVIHGLSAGGYGTWDYITAHPKDIAAALPMAAASTNTIPEVDKFKHMPIWESQGGLDKAPSPFTAQMLVDEIVNKGGNIRFTLYKNLGHGVWSTHYNEADFWPFILRANKTIPIVMNGEMTLVSTSQTRDVFEFITKYEPCPGETISVRMGLTPGFEQYEWRKDGVTIPGATSNEYIATEFGVYDARFKRSGSWSPWSVRAIEIKQKAPTITPNIQVNGFNSKVIPALNGEVGVSLAMPEGYVAYGWKLDGTNTILSTDRIFYATQPGRYVATVTEKFGCSSNFSTPFTVIPASGPNAPPALSGVAGAALSKTSIKIQWSTVQNPLNPAISYEIYRSLIPGSSYELIHIAGENDSEFTDVGLVADTYYYYVIRPINNTSGAIPSPELAIRTEVDRKSPSTPVNLRTIRINGTEVALAWDASTDDIAVYRYDVYRNGVLAKVSETNSTVVFNLQENQTYQFQVKARDFTGNTSPFSNLVVVTAAGGMTYKYYPKTWGNNLLDFNTLTPTLHGALANADITVSPVTTNYGMLFQGKITIPVAGNYTFQTRSDDGSKLYIGAYAESNLVVNNDGAHGMQTREGTYNFSSAGTYPIFVSYYQGGSSRGLELYWRNTAHGITSAQRITDSDLRPAEVLSSTVPTAPASITVTQVSYDKINVSWSDNSGNETGFQVFRSTTLAGPYFAIGTTAANATTFQDTGLDGNTTYYYQVIALGATGASSDVNNLRENLGLIKFGIGAIDNATGTGYIMYSRQNLFVRFTNPKVDVNNSLNLVAVKYINNQWHYDNNSVNTPFTPVSSDLLIASVNYSTDAITSLQGTFSVVNGINAGFASGDLTFFANRWNGASNAGEFTINGTFFNRNSGPVAQATTLPLPPAPSTPVNFVATSVSASELLLNWNIVPDADGYKIYRSTSLNGTYLLIEDINSKDSVSFKDSELISHTHYHYRLLAYNVGGNSSTTNANASTLNSIPVIEDISDAIIRHSTEFDLQLLASDADGDMLEFSAVNLPSFAILSNYGDGDGLIAFTPAEADQGTYNNIIVQVTDGFGGVARDTITLTVNDNYSPQLTSVQDVDMNEGKVVSISLTAQDVEGAENLVWSGLYPAFAQLTPSGNGSATLTLSPYYTDQGSHEVLITVTDPAGAEASIDFTVNVLDTNPNRVIKVNFTDGSLTSPNNWNNTQGHPVLGATYSNLIDSEGGPTNFDLSIITTWVASGSNTLGATTGNNSGVYPDNVIKSSYWTQTGKPQMRISDLNDSLKYNLAFFGSRAANDDRSTRYTVGTQSVVLNAASNTSRTVSINNIQPSNGQIVFTTERAGASSYGYINALVIEEVFDDGMPPASPNFVNTNISITDGTVTLTWNDRAFNESGYRVYRGQQSTGAFTLLANLNTPNTKNYVDNSVASNSNYYYYVEAYNDNGISQPSEVVSASLPNLAPILVVDANIIVPTGQIGTLSVSATDAPGEVVVLSAVGLPSFASLTTTQNGTASIEIQPGFSNLGEYSVTISATDNGGLQSSKVVIIKIVPSDLFHYYINFAGSSTYITASPWNNYVGNAAAGDQLTQIKSTKNGENELSLTFQNAWSGYNTNGMLGSTLYPNTVTQTAIWIDGDSKKMLLISNLSTARTYDFTFFASRSGSGDRTTEYNINGQSVFLNASSNKDNTVTLSRIVPNNNGEVVITVNKTPSSFFGYLNALVISGYTASEVSNIPSNLTVKPASSTSIAVNWADNANGELSYEVWRATSTIASGFVLHATLPANTRSYQDMAVTPGTTYYYKVRAGLSDGEFSGFSNTAGASVLNATVYINFNVENPAALPWNNTNSFPDPGKKFSNLLNDKLNNSGIAFEIVASNPAYNPDLYGFSGDNPFGMTTGNNSGVVPDNVMSSTYWLDPGKVAELRFFNMDLTQNYTFKFFASRNGPGNRVSVYQIGEQVAKLNASYNTSNLAEIKNVFPDSNGEVWVKITSDEGALFSYIGGLIIESSNDADNVRKRKADDDPREDAEVSSEDILVSVHPNPVGKTEILKVRVSGLTNDAVETTLYSAKGEKLVSKNFGIIGTDGAMELNLSEVLLQEGMYLLKVHTKKGTVVTQKILIR
jgi:chitodextrinase/predicted esterase